MITIKRKLKYFLKATLNTIISLQLCFMPGYVYSVEGGEHNRDRENNTEETNTFIQNILNQLKEKNANAQKETIERIDAALALAQAVEEGKVEQYLLNNPGVRQERDHFLLANQQVDSIEYHFDFDKNKVVEKTTETINLNDYKNRPVPTVFTDVRVLYNEQSRELILEGISSETVMLRQRIPDMDIMNYAHDREVLVLLDKRKGLLLVDMFLARAYLGLAPVPVIRVSVPILQTLKKTVPDFESGKESSILMEFINRSVRPPDIIPEGTKNIDKNFHNDFLFTAGDFLISYMDSNGKKHLLQFIKRTEIAGWVKLNYDVLDIMTKVVAPQLMQQEDIKLFHEEINNLRQKDPDIMLDHILSALFTKSALHKLSLARDGLQHRVEQLKELSPRDTMLFEEWKEAFNTVSAQLNSSHDAQEERKISGEVLPTAAIASLLKESEKNDSAEKEQKKYYTKALKMMKHFINKQRKEHYAKALRMMGHFINKHRVSTVLVGGSVSAGFAFPEKFILLVNEFLPFIHNLSRGESFSTYQMTSLPNLLTMFVFLPGIIILLSWASIPFIKKFKSKLPNNISIAGKVYHPKGWAEDVFNKWKDADISQRIVGVGMQIVAWSIYPFWNYLAKIVGQPHFFSAIQKGLNPFKVVRPESDVGEMAQIRRPIRLGSQGVRPQWKQNDSFNQQRQLQNIAMAKQQRMQSISWLMASLAVAERERVSPTEILVYGASSVNLSELEKTHNDETLRLEMLWVMNNLLKEIQQLNEMDIRKELAEMKPEMVIRYYEKAKQLAQEVKSHSKFSKKAYKFRNTIRKFLVSIPNLNSSEHKMLRNVPSHFVKDRVMTEFYSDHFMVSLLPLLTTQRAEFGLEYIDQLAVNEGNFSWSGKPHLQEVWFNVIAHFFIAGAQRTITFTQKTTAIQEAYNNQMAVYKPIEEYRNKTGSNTQGESTYYFKQLSYFASGGQKDNLGGVMWRAYKSRLRSLQMTLSLMVGTRILVGEQNPMDALMGFALYHFAGQWVFGWPWDVIHGGARVNGHNLAKNRERMESVKLSLSRVARGVHLTEEDLKKEYQEALTRIVSLYKRRTLRRTMIDTIKDINPQLVDSINNLSGKKNMESSEMSFTSDNIEKIQLTSTALMKLLTEHPPLTNQPNKTANHIFTGVFGALMTTYLFVTLSVWTFSPEHLTLENIALWAAINYTLYGGFYFLYKKSLGEHKKWFKERWKYIRNWKSYFYERALNMNYSVRNTCRKIFPGK